MISIIICSPDNTRAAWISQHVETSIGVPYELIVVSDAAAQGGMCPAYNSAAAKAQYDLLCFMHDDVEFLTPAWGERVLAHFKNDKDLGLIGLAGSRYKSVVISGWATGQADEDCCYIRQSVTGAPASETRLVKMHPGKDEGSPVPVKTLDGVWLCTRKTVWQQVGGFSNTIPGFHFYDLDFSLRVSQLYKTTVVYDIDLVHFSQGNFGAAWVENAIRFHEEWNKVPLPVSIDVAPAGIETAVQRFWLNRLLKEKISMSLRRRWVKLNAAFAQSALRKEAFKFLIFPVYHRLKTGTKL